MRNETTKAFQRNEFIPEFMGKDDCCTAHKSFRWINQLVQKQNKLWTFSALSRRLNHVVKIIIFNTSENKIDILFLQMMVKFVLQTKTFMKNTFYGKIKKKLDILFDEKYKSKSII